MKYLPALFPTGLLTVAALALTVHAQAPKATEDPFVKSPAEPAAAKPSNDWKNCLVVFEAYALAKDDALSVIENEHGGVARYQRTSELAKAGKAQLKVLSAIVTSSGQRAVVEANDEVRYATEFSPPADDKSPASPNAWEVRNAGDTLEIEPVISPDGHHCDFNVVPQRVSLLGIRDAAVGVGISPVAQPLFHVQKLMTSSTTNVGEPLYLGTYTPPFFTDGAKPNETWLAFIHVDAFGPNPKAAKATSDVKHPSQLQYEYSIYSLDRMAARDLLVTPSPVGASWDKLQALVGEKKARFEHLSTITTASGQRAVAEETREERYWTELNPGGRAATVDTTQRTVDTGPSQNPSQPSDKKDYSKRTTTTETVTVTRQDVNAARIPAYATAFETRNTGTTVELEPVYAPDGESVNINQVVSQTTFLGSLKMNDAAAKYPAVPLFESRKMTTSQTVPIGVHVLIGTLNSPEADGVNGREDSGRTSVVFVRVTPNEP